MTPEEYVAAQLDDAGKKVFLEIIQELRDAYDDAELQAAASDRRQGEAEIKVKDMEAILRDVDSQRIWATAPKCFTCRRQASNRELYCLECSTSYEHFAAAALKKKQGGGTP